MHGDFNSYEPHTDSEQQKFTASHNPMSHYSNDYTDSSMRRNAADWVFGRAPQRDGLAPPYTRPFSLKELMLKGISYSCICIYLVFILEASDDFRELYTSSNCYEIQLNKVNRTSWFDINVSNEFVSINNIRSIVCFITYN